MSNIVIIGAGMAGLGAAHHFKENNIKATIFEKNNYFGGHAATFEKDGFIFDDGPHISFTKNERLRKLFHESVNGKVENFKADVNNYWKGYWVKHPAQANLHGLPDDLVVKILREFFELSQQNGGKVENYKDWLYESFGETFSENFPFQYTKKFHTTTPDNLDTDWIGPRMYKPDLDKILKGALSKSTEDVHYVSDFYYPSYGGFARFFDRFLEQTQVEYEHKVVKIDPKNKQISFSNGKTMAYDHLISSVPLPELVPCIEGVPDEVLEASQKLACTTCVLVNVGVARDDISKAHWTYFYDQDIVFSRLSYPHLFSPNNTPENCGSIQAEIYFSKKYKPLTSSPEDFIEPTILDLKRCGILNDSDEIIYREARVSPYANVIFDLERIPSLATVHNYLNQIDIKYCGRFGEWGYHWTDQSFISGENAAEKVLEQLKSDGINGKSSLTAKSSKPV
ncbi:FAD-binding protein [Mariniphaga sediminis]|uniref:FAD-binding protein n=1 Tax=Mariniphaga sediminis TaxID=1628158 RepID=A0A399D4M4_9BACT|nr:FAD-dependent oxidoreductase [Mariniphaga sediminis]RIH65691.1 FAD-binding protein [Mariniphaga sediminis]